MITLRNAGNKIAAAVLLVAVFSSTSRAYIADGLLGDWGVTPFTNWTPSSPSAEWVGGPGENNFGGPNNTVSLNGFGGERFDAEAAYFDDDKYNIYFAIVTSFPQAGAESSGITYRTGDVAFNILPGGSYGYEYGVKTTGAGFGKLALNPTWSLPNAAQGWASNGPSEFSGGSVLGTVPLAYYNTGIYDNGYTNYVIEGAISKSLLPFMWAGQDVQMHWTMSCGNDALDLTGKISNPVPEPATMALFGAGLAGLAFRKRKASKNV